MIQAAAGALLFLIGCFCGYVGGAWVRPEERIQYRIVLAVIALVIFVLGL